MKRTTANYRITMPNMVRFAIDHIRRRNPTARDADLLGFIMHAGVQQLLKDSPEVLEETEGSTLDEGQEKVIAFPISPRLNERLQKLLLQYPGEEERIQAELIDIGLSFYYHADDPKDRLGQG